jgi:hypothetical protein
MDTEMDTAAMVTDMAGTTVTDTGIIMAVTSMATVTATETVPIMEDTETAANLE